jgi:sugar transferase (PEP-CTERM/EpsH1 system associated)
MRVLFLSQIVPYPPHGGVLQRGYNLIRELGRDAEVHLLAFVHPDVLPTPEALAGSRVELEKHCRHVEYFPLWAKASIAHKLLAAGTSALSSSPFSVIAHRSAAFQRRVTETLQSSVFDIVHVDTLALAPFVDRALPTPTVLTHHNIESMLMGRRAQVETRPLLKQFLARESAKLTDAEREMSPQFDMNIVMSEADQRVLAELAPAARSAVVPNGVDTKYFTPDPSQETPALIYTGGMNMFANRDAVMHFLTDIWPLIRARNTEVVFYAVGQDPPKELQAIAEADPRVVVTGYVDDIRPFVRKAAVYVVPLRVGGGTRLKVLDAMAMGKAMVSTSIGCEGIEATPGTHLMIADRPDIFAETTLALLSDPARRLELSRAARARVEERYAWPGVGRLLFDAYQGAIDARRLR